MMSMGGWVIIRDGKFWRRTANSRHSDVMGEWVTSAHFASVFHPIATAERVADEIGGEVYDYAAAIDNEILEREIEEKTR